MFSDFSKFPTFSKNIFLELWGPSQDPVPPKRSQCIGRNKVCAAPVFCFCVSLCFYIFFWFSVFFWFFSFFWFFIDFLLFFCFFSWFFHDFCIFSIIIFLLGFFFTVVLPEQTCSYFDLCPSGRELLRFLPREPREGSRASIWARKTLLDDRIFAIGNYFDFQDASSGNFQKNSKLQCVSFPTGR